MLKDGFLHCFVIRLEICRICYNKFHKLGISQRLSHINPSSYMESYGEICFLLLSSRTAPKRFVSRLLPRRMLGEKGDYSSKEVAIPKTQSMLAISTIHLHYFRNSVYETPWTIHLKDFNEHYISSFTIDVGRFRIQVDSELCLLREQAYIFNLKKILFRPTRHPYWPVSLWPLRHIFQSLLLRLFSWF